MTTQEMLSPLRRAIQDFDMIQDGDKVAVGISGGKDSLALLTLLKAYQRFADHKFDLMGITIDMGFAQDTYKPVQEYCLAHEIEYKVIPTDIAEIVFDVRKEKNPCSLCSKMRRGALNNAIIDLGYNKLALGHHQDDVVETFLLSLFHEGRLNTFQPVSFMSRSNVTLIRPLIYAEEKNISAYARDENLPVVESPCPANKHTERETMKDILKELAVRYPDVRQKFASAITHPERYNLWDKLNKEE